MYNLTNRFHLSVNVYSTLKCGKNISKRYLPAARRILLCSYHVLISSEYICTAKWNLFLNTVSFNYEIQNITVASIFILKTYLNLYTCTFIGTHISGALY